MKKPNAIVMVDAIKEEVEAANIEGRSPRSSNVIAIFKKKRKTLSNDEVNELFDIVFRGYRAATGVQVIGNN